MRQKQTSQRGGPFEVDEIDVRMLAILQNEGRINKSDLAGRVHLSNSACYERMRRLEEAGIIQSYHARINILQLGNPQLLQTHVNLASHRSEDFARFERRILEEDMIIECYGLSGGIDYALTVWALHVSDYQALIDRLLDADLGINRYFTYIITKQVKQQDIRIEDLIGRKSHRGPQPGR